MTFYGYDLAGNVTAMTYPSGRGRVRVYKATAIRIGNPRSWKKALRAVQNTGGWVMDVTDEEIGEADDD